MKFKLFIILYIIIFNYVDILAQDVSKLKLLDTQKGLSNGRVTSILQDSIGFIWLGTKNGLNRYDGSNVKIYNSRNSFLKSNDISVLKLDTKNRFWVGTIGSGILKYNSKKDEFNSYNLNSNINTIFEDTSGNIWVGTNKGLLLYKEENDSFHNVNVEKGLNISSLLELDKNQILVGTNGEGLFILNKKSKDFKPFLRQELLQSAFINVLYQYKSNEILIGTNGNGLLKLNKNLNKLTPFFKDKIKATIIRTIYSDYEKNLWIGTDGQGVYKVLKNTNNKLSQIDRYFKDNKLQYKLVNNTVNSIFQDNQKNVWIGTAWKGTNIIEKKSKTPKFYFSDYYGENSAPVLSIFKENKKIWVGTDGNGLNIIENNKDLKTPYKKTKNYLEGEYIQVIKKSLYGYYWIGTFSNGLLKFHPKKGIINKYERNSNDSETLPYNDVRDVLELKSGDLWVATWGGGLAYFNREKQTFLIYKNDKEKINSISSNEVLAIQNDSIGNLWIATWGGGLNYFDVKEKTFSRYNLVTNDSESTGSNYIFSLEKGKDNNLWLGTKTGLVKFDVNEKKIKKISLGFTDNSNTVVGLLLSEEKVWASTKDGIYSYNSKTNKVEAFRDFKGEYHINSTFKDSNKFLYFGGAEGFVVFNPKKVSAENTPLKIIFTDFKLFNKSLNIEKESVFKSHISFEKQIKLEYNQNVFTFNFSILEYPFAKKAQFLVKMDGFEENWRNIGTEKSATYTNLSPGDYTFKVKTKTLDDKRSDSISVNLVILPPFWLTWWAYVIYFFLAIILLLLVRKYTINWATIKNRLEVERHKREEQNKLHQIKQRFFANISHEIRTPLTLIMSSLNVLQKEDVNSVQKKSISVVKNNTRRLLNLVNELLNFRKLETGNLKLSVQKTNIVSFVNEVFLAFSQEAIINNIEYKFISENKKINVWIDRIQLEKAIFNLISNAFKFTERGDSISLSIKKTKKNLEIAVLDTGKGISEDKLPHIFERFYHAQYQNSEKGFGIGLSIAKDIIKLHSGKINVKSILNSGSKFLIKIPLGKEHFKINEIKEETFEEENLENYKKGKINFKEFKGKTILLVEDNKHLRGYLKDLLLENYLIIEAENGEIGLKKALEIVPDLIISDVMMPKMDGFSLCYNIKTDVRISHIPIILLTARSFSVDKIEGLKNGADDYLIKPFDEEVLKARIYNLLRNRVLIHERFSKDTILTPKDLVLSSPDEELLNKLVKLLETNIENSEFSVEELSIEIGMSHSSLYKKIKVLTGMTLVGFIRDFRLQRAAQLFKNNKISIIDVCFMVGYTDRKHFSQEFKKKFKVSPTTYIKENQ